MGKILLLLFSFFLLVLFFPPKPASAQILTTDKLITIDTGAQKLTAWDGGKVVYETKVSTGMKLTPTVKGSFKIYFKTPLTDMRGPSPYKDIYPSGKYLVEDVPDTMYFYQGYAIHGAYWHNNFGRVASHGCVNTPLVAAKWLYDWAPLGTRVEVW
jgi:lipoprotein-anchoring transpeptidase ErfK/SrfK